MCCVNKGHDPKAKEALMNLINKTTIKYVRKKLVRVFKEILVVKDPMRASP